MPPSTDSIWEDAYSCFEIVRAEPADEVCVDSDAEDEFGNNLGEQEIDDLHSRVVRLPDGDIHVCSACCPYAEPDKQGNCTCPYTGRVILRVCEERTDYSTGRSTYSADPDVAAGGPMGGAWRKKRDMKKASASAYQSAHSIDDTTMPKAQHSTKPTRQAPKRGALCVDEQAPDDCGPKRARTSKKDVGSIATLSLLVDEATSTFVKLLGKELVCAARKSANSAKPAVPAVDPRLLDRDILFKAALKKYLKETLSVGGVPSMDAVHNIALAVEAVVVEEKRRLLDASTARCGKVSSLTFKANAARLAVALWTGACQTPYLAKARRGADSFRPFCAGAYYAMKRGLTLADGTVLVPRCDEFTDALPRSRTIAADPALKSLHASSHRGLCTIHRCIASVDAKEAHGLFAEAIRAAKSF